MKHIFIFSACSMMALSSLSAANYNTNSPNNNSNNSNASFQNNNSNTNLNNARTNNNNGYTTIQSDLNDATAAEARQNSYNNQSPNLATVEAQMTQQKTAAQPASATTTTTTTTTATDASKGASFVSDQDLTKAIYKAIREDRMFTGDSKIKVQVTVYNGKVTLSGEVATEAEKARAELLANQVNKLHGVTNNIKVVR